MMNKREEITLRDLFVGVKQWLAYLFGKKRWIIIVGLVFGILGFLYATFQKPQYVAELSFAPEYDNNSGVGGYLGLASQFGFDLGTGGGIFEGENLVQLLKSNMMVRRALLSPVKANGQDQLLINYYVKSKELEKRWREKPELKNIVFSADFEPGVRARDSIMKNIVKEVSNNLTIEKRDKNFDFVVARYKDEDELFAVMLLETLVENGIKFYVDYRSKKSKENVAILQRQTDSVETLLTGSIISVARSNDLNVNPVKQIARAGAQRKQVDVQVTGQVYAELLKQLELSKIALRKETPLVQVIDKPYLPLEKKKLGRLKGSILFAFLGVLLTSIFYVVKRLVS